MTLVLQELQNNTTRQATREDLTRPKCIMKSIRMHSLSVSNLVEDAAIRITYFPPIDGREII